MSNEVLDGGSVREIERLALASTATVEIGGRSYSRVPLHDPRKPEPQPATLVFHSLQSLVEYVRGPHDNAYGANRGLFVHVSDPTTVRLCTAIFGEFNQRTELARADAYVPPLRFGEFVDPESFSIALQAHFEPGTDRAAVLAIVGGLQTEAVQTVSDDGVSQVATARKGIVSVASVKVPNPVTLRPRRTFVEVAQPDSPFVLRLRGGGDGKLPSCALFEADGGAWRLAAIERIKAWLKTQLEGACAVYG